jgi:hypothetical protein
VYAYFGLIQYTAGRLWRHVDHKTSLAVPALKRLDHVAVRRKPFAVGRNVDDRRLDQVQDENRRSAMMIDRLLIVGLQRDLEHADPSFSKRTL